MKGIKGKELILNNITLLASSKSNFTCRRELSIEELESIERISSFYLIRQTRIKSCWRRCDKNEEKQILATSKALSKLLTERWMKRLQHE